MSERSVTILSLTLIDPLTRSKDLLFILYQSVSKELPKQLIEHANNKEKHEQGGQHRNQIAEFMNNPFDQ